MLQSVVCLSEGGERRAHISQSSVWVSSPAHSSPGHCVRTHMHMEMPLGFTSAAERCLGAAGMLEAESLVPKGSRVLLSQGAQADGQETAGWERWLVLSDRTKVMFLLGTWCRAWAALRPWAHIRLLGPSLSLYFSGPASLPGSWPFSPLR